jgi:tRNA(Ile)-lysidine synthase TilS/MesJ
MEDYQFKRTYGKWFLSRVKRAIYRYSMIKAGDKIAVGVSGGKDSTALLYIMWLLKHYSPLSFDYHAIFLDLGWPVDPAPLASFCRKLNIPFHLEKTDIGAIVFEHRREDNPCALCAHLRRGALNNAALRLGCNKVALGHHLDDLLETFLLNWIFNGRLATFIPVTHLARSGLVLIRPLIYLPEATLAGLARSENLPVMENPCPASGKTKREEMRSLVKQMAGTYPDIREKFLTAIENAGWLEPGFYK